MVTGWSNQRVCKGFARFGEPPARAPERPGKPVVRGVRGAAEGLLKLEDVRQGPAGKQMDELRNPWPVVLPIACPFSGQREPAPG